MTRLAALEAKAELTADEEIELFLARIDLGQLELEAAKAQADKLGATGDAAKKVDSALLSLEIKAALQGVRSQEQAVAAGKQMLQLHEQGRIPTDKGMVTANYWRLISEHAFAEKDAELFKKCLDGIKAALGDDETYQRFYAQMEQRLAEISG